MTQTFIFQFALKILFILTSNFSIPGYYLPDYEPAYYAPPTSIGKNDKSSNSGVPNICMQCGKSYRHAHHLKRHLKFECGVPPKFFCAYCPQRSKHKSDIKNHVIRCHKDQPLNFYMLWSDLSESLIKLVQVV